MRSCCSGCLRLSSISDMKMEGSPTARKANAASAGRGVSVTPKVSSRAVRSSRRHAAIQLASSNREYPVSPWRKLRSWLLASSRRSIGLRSSSNGSRSPFMVSHVEGPVYGVPPIETSIRASAGALYMTDVRAISLPSPVETVITRSADSFSARRNCSLEYRIS